MIINNFFKNEINDLKNKLANLETYNILDNYFDYMDSYSGENNTFENLFIKNLNRNKPKLIDKALKIVSETLSDTEKTDKILDMYWNGSYYEDESSLLRTIFERYFTNDEVALLVLAELTDTFNYTYNCVTFEDFEETYAKLQSTLKYKETNLRDMNLIKTRYANKRGLLLKEIAKMEEDKAFLKSIEV